MGDQFIDIVMVTTEARVQREKARSRVPIETLRRDAVCAYAEREYRNGKRFKSLESAEKSIHDACSRRLKPDVTSIEDFDRLLEAWLKTKSPRLGEVLNRHARTEQHRALIKAFFDPAVVTKPESESSN